MPKTPLYPHDCPDCGEPAYVGLGVPCLCSNPDCPFFDPKSLEDTGIDEGTEDFLDDDKTDPQWTIPMPTIPRGLGAWGPAPPIPLGDKGGSASREQLRELFPDSPLFDDDNQDGGGI